MPKTTHTLHYAGETFQMSAIDYENLKALYDRGAGVPVLWRFAPTDRAEDVAVAVGGGATFYVTTKTEI